MNNQQTTLCPFCGCGYAIGVNGTIEGCDECTGTVRNPRDGTIVNMDFSKVFADNEDEVTDMEKA